MHQHLREIRHRQHAVREHVVHPGGLGESAVDVERHMIVAGPGEQRQRRAVDRAADQLG
jgi:hypothetical protein